MEQVRNSERDERAAGWGAMGHRRTTIVALTLLTTMIATLFALVPEAEAATREQATIVAPVAGRITSQPSNTAHYLGSNDWSTDIGARARSNVRAKFTNATGTLKLKVRNVRQSCGGGRSGGKAVTVEVRVDGTLIGTVDYLHLSNIKVRAGQNISNGAVLGKVATGLPVNSRCWTGPHVHMAAYNQSSYSCYVRKTSVSTSSHMGVLGGQHARSVRGRCPSGATNPGSSSSNANVVRSTKYRVTGTAGSGLRVRSAPTTAGARIGSIREGQRISIICQVRNGQNVLVRQSGGPTFYWRVWNKVKLPNGRIGYAHDGWTTVPAGGGGIPRC